MRSIRRSRPDLVVVVAVQGGAEVEVVAEVEDVVAAAVEAERLLVVAVVRVAMARAEALPKIKWPSWLRTLFECERRNQALPF